MRNVGPAIRLRTGGRSRGTDSIARMIAEWRRQRPDIDASPLEILGRIQRLSTHMQRIAESSLRDTGLTWETFSLIATLRRSGRPFALRPTDIYRQSLLTSGTVTKRIDNVERMGLVERVRDGKDRRSIIVRLTPSGIALADRAIGIHMRVMADVMSALSRKERGQTAALLSKLLLAIEEPARPVRKRTSAHPTALKSPTVHNRST